MAWYNWSRTAASNATADTSINMAEGMAPSQVNDGIRALMARTAEYRDDIAGAIATGGTSTAYTVTSYSVFDTLAHMANQMIAFTPHATNGATVTLNVDGLGAKPLRTAPSTELLAGVLIQGTPYVATYNNSDAVWYLQGFYGNPYNVPLGAGLEYWLPTAPNSSFVFPIGQAISRTTYATLFSAMGTTHGIGDGSTTFNLPDKRGRISAMKEDVANLLTSTYFGGDSTALGTKAGAERETIAAGNLPANIPNTLGATFTPSSGGATIYVGTNTGSVPSNTPTVGVPITPTPITLGGSVAITGAINGSGVNTPLVTVQPTIICNYILRII